MATDQETIEIAKEWRDPSEWTSTPAAVPIGELRLIGPSYADAAEENPGQARFRQRAIASEIIRLPPQLAPAQQSATRQAFYQRRPRDAARNTSRDPFETRFPELHELRRRYGIEMRLVPQNRYDASKGLAIELWGDDRHRAQNVKMAVAAIEKWIAEYTGGRTPKSDKFPKASSVMATQARHRELEAYNAKRSFCQDPTEEELEELHSIATFQWPSDFGQPRNLLGHSLEMLDSIRMEELCFIRLDPARMLFKVHGKHPKAVKAGLLRLRGVYYQISASKIEPQSLHLAEPYTAYSRPLVKLTPCAWPKADKPPIMRPSLYGSVGIVDLMDAPIETEKAKLRNNDKAKAAAVKTLSGLKYYRGNLSMRIRLGNFTLVKYWVYNRPMPRDRFHVMMNDPSMQGEITERFDGCFDVADLEAGRISASLELEPLHPKPAPTFAKSSKVGAEPIIAATMILYTDKGYLQLQLEYEADVNGHMDRTVTRWSRIAKPGTEPPKLLDVSMVDLDQDLAWNLEIEASGIVADERMPGLIKYAEDINIVGDRSILQDARFNRLLFTIKRHSDYKLHTIIQRKIWRYRVQQTDYISEISQVRRFNVLNPDSISGLEYKMQDLDWTLHVTSDVWARCLDENGILGVGEGATWRADASVFFPPPMNDAGRTDYDGFNELVSRVENLGFAWREGSHSGG